MGYFPSRSAAQKGAKSIQRRRRIHRVVARSVLVGVAAVAGLAVTLSMRTEANPDHRPARAVADRLDAIMGEVEAGALDIEAVARTHPGVDGASFLHAGLTKLGLTAVVDDDCFGLVWRSGQRVSGTVFRSHFDACVPDAALIDPATSAAEPIRPSWELALPEPERTRPWFIPAVVVLSGMLLGAFTRATSLLLEARR